MMGRSSGKGGGGRSEVDDGIVIMVILVDLTEEVQHRIQEEMKKELEEVEATKMREKLAWYQKIMGGVMQKADTVKASSSKVDSASLTPEELAHLVDMLVANKYGTDLAQLTHALGENLHHALESFQHDLDDSILWQVRTVVN
jgi:hypothetical protein